MKIGVIGAGSWGTTMANLLALKGYDVSLWVYEEELCGRMRETGINDLYLPGITLSKKISPTRDLEEAASGKDIVVSAAPAQIVRGVISRAVPYISDRSLIVSLSKGIEEGSLKLMSEVLEGVFPSGMHDNLCYLSGPSFAREVSLKMPTAVVIASRDEKNAEAAQAAFTTGYFRVYTHDDVVGVELGGAVKNVIAVAAGMADGLGYGNNTRAALITRGLAEIARLGVRLGGNPLTFSGLAGLGDLVLTCTGELSRNRTVGFKIGQGMTLAQATDGMKMVAEGVPTARAVQQLAVKLGVDMPISEHVYKILYEGMPAKEAVIRLMSREMKMEQD